MTGLGTAFVSDGDQARAFLAHRPEVDHLIALAPIARAALDAAGVSATASDKIYSDCAHARVAARARRARRSCAELFSRHRMDASAAEMLMILTMEVSPAAGATWELLRATQGPWCIYDGTNWRRIGDRRAAHEALMDVLLRQFLGRPKTRYTYPTTPLAWLARAVFSAATLCASSRGIVVLHEVRRGLEDLVESIETNQRVDVLTIGFSPKSWRAFATNALKLVLGSRGGMRLLPPLWTDPGTRNAVNRALTAYNDDAVIARGLKVFGDLIAESCAQTAALAADLAPAFRRLRVRSLVVWDMGNVKTVAYSHAARRAGTRVFVAGHAAVAIPNQPLAQVAAESRAVMTTGGNAVDVAIVQSPTFAAAVSQIAPQLPQLKALPFLWRDAPQRIPTPAAEPALFLWAGNFARWSKHRPWADETPDETLLALIRLAEAVIATPSIRLEARIKPNWRIKGDIDAAALDRYVPKHERIVITAEGSFVDSLGRATAIVTHSSTAFEEALRARLPVILWGARGRTNVLPGRAEPPNGNSRAAIYTPPWHPDLGPFLSAVANAHRNQPLTDAEVDSLIWNEGAADVMKLGRVLANS